MDINNFIKEKGILSPELFNVFISKMQLAGENNLLDFLIKKGVIDKEKYLKILSAYKGNLDYVLELKGLKTSANKIPVTLLRQHIFVPLKVTDNYAEFAAADPLSWELQQLVKRYYPDKQLKFVLAYKEDIFKIIKQLEYTEVLTKLIDKIKKELHSLSSEDELNTENNSAIMEFIRFIIRDAIEKKASDIHIEPYKDYAVIKLRIIGILTDLFNVDLDVFNALNSRLKLLAKLDISEKKKPQDGNFSMEIDGNQFDFRFSSLPTVWGESLVIRVLDKRNILKKIDNIGINPINLNMLKTALSKPNGIFLVTGPTGSGKTTTLYAFLNELINGKTKIITVEDPVEYKLEGIQQVQVNPKVNLTFAGALRSILRQDPDIIMIGEIRDAETLEIAIKAALTGHLVISTLHTNDAVSAITRMIDMGAEPFMIASALVGVEAQRLIKVNCSHCKHPYQPKKSLLVPLIERGLITPSTTFYISDGCEKCNFTGYSGRKLITEVFLNDDTLEDLITFKKSKIEILKYLKEEQKYEPMFYDALKLAIKGIVSLDEVYRVAKLQ